MNYKFDKLIHGLEQLNISYTAVEIEDKFSVYYEMLVEKNKVMNLTSITEFDEVMVKHFLDSAAVAAYIDLDQPYKLLDLGTGAGFPGIPLKILFPKLEIVLMDSLNKRIRFLDEVITKLQLQDIIAVHGRAEELARKEEYREQFDLCVSRAVANLSSLSEYCLPFVKVGGKFIAYKSKEVEEEAASAKNAVHLLGGKLEAVHQFELPGTDFERAFVVVDKIQETPKKYPRKAGTPGKLPL